MAHSKRGLLRWLQTHSRQPQTPLAMCSGTAASRLPIYLKLPTNPTHKHTVSQVGKLVPRSAAAAAQALAPRAVEPHNPLCPAALFSLAHHPGPWGLEGLRQSKQITCYSSLTLTQLQHHWLVLPKADSGLF
jgi:hypothetical protein